MSSSESDRSISDVEEDSSLEEEVHLETKDKVEDLESSQDSASSPEESVENTADGNETSENQVEESAELEVHSDEEAPEQNSITEEESSSFKEEVRASDAPTYTPPPPNFTPEDPTPQSKFYKVTTVYEPDEAGYLLLREGDIIIFLSDEGDNVLKGQLGDEIGLFSKEHVESITEDEVKSFIKSQKPSSKKKAELQDTMKRLKLEEEETSLELERLRKELDVLKQDAAERRKKVRLELSETMEILPASLYKIDPLDNFQYDLVKHMIQLEALIHSESQNREATTILSEHLNVFLTTFQQHSQMDSKLKTESEKVQTHARMILSGLMNEMANYDVSIVRKLIKDMEVLVNLIGDKQRVEEAVSSTPKKIKKKSTKEKTKTKSKKDKTKGEKSPRSKVKSSKKKKDKGKE